MQFNSVKRGNFSRLAGHVNKVTDQAFQAARETAVDNTAIAKESMKGRSLERRAAMKAEAEVAQAGLKAATKVKLTDIKIDAAESVRKSKASANRMAGMVAGLGAITGGIVSMEGAKKDKAERDADRAYEQDVFDRTQAMLKDTAEQSADLRKQLQESVNTPTNSKPLKTDSSVRSLATSTTSASPSKGKSGRSNWGALSSIIRKVEGTSGDKGYTTRFGGHQFDDLSRHPNIAAPTPWGTKSEAAGAYQFMKPTWDEAKSALGLTDFSRESQEKAGRFLAQRRGVNPDARLNSFEEFSAAISKLSPEWAGLPNSQKGRTGYHGQANASMQDLWTQYQNYYN